MSKIIKMNLSTSCSGSTILTSINSGSTYTTYQSNFTGTKLVISGSPISTFTGRTFYVKMTGGTCGNVTQPINLYVPPCPQPTGTTTNWESEVDVCFYSLIELPRYLITFEPNYYRFYTTSMVVNGIEYITNGNINYNASPLKWIRAYNNVASGHTNNNIQYGFTYTNQVDFMNQLFTTLGLTGYRAQISLYPLELQFNGNREIDGFYIIKPKHDTFSFKIISADGTLTEAGINYVDKESVIYSDNIPPNYGVITENSVYNHYYPTFTCDNFCYNFYLNDSLVVVEGDKRLNMPKPVDFENGDSNSPISYGQNGEFYVSGTAGFILNYSFYNAQYDLNNHLTFNPVSDFIRSETKVLTSGVNTITFNNLTRNIAIMINGITNPTTGCYNDETNQSFIVVSPRA